METVDHDVERPPLGRGVVAATEAVATGKLLAGLGLNLRLELHGDRIGFVDEDGAAVSVPLDRISGIRLGSGLADGWRARVGAVMGARPGFLIQLHHGAGQVRVSGNLYNEEFKPFMRSLAELVLRDHPAIAVEIGGRLASALLAAIVCVTLGAGALILVVTSVINRDAASLGVALAAVLILGFMIREAFRRLPRRVTQLAAVDRAFAS